MNLHELEVNLKQLTKNLEDFANDIAPQVVGKTAKDFYKESFQKQGFTGDSLTSWKEVKRREAPSRPDRAASSRNILTGATGNLGRSIDYACEKGKVTITAEVFSATGFNYAPVHNWGTPKMPQRQFVGESETLNRIILDKIKERIKEITNK